jgi:hypothetical protein
MSQSGDMASAAHQARETRFRMVRHQASVLAYNTVFRLLAGFLFLVPFIFLMRRPESKRGLVAQH